LSPPEPDAPQAGPKLPAFAASDDEAQQRFDMYRSVDPFPGIDAALLNGADLVDYIAATGMVHPFVVDPKEPDKTLKPASCAIPCGGDLLFWRETYDEASGTMKQTEIRQTLRTGDVLTIEPNSIAYVSLEAVFRIPDYIAARFNLAIREIHRGFLVGTGPLVDPGFVGRLSVPLHNLTANEYHIVAGEPLVWMEFTKLSANLRWTGHEAVERQGTYVPFPQRKLSRKTLDDYLSRAHDGPIVSSIPHAVGRAQYAAAAAAKEASRIRNLTIGVGVGVLLAVGAIVVDVMGLIDDAGRDRTALESELSTVQEQLRKQEETIDTQEDRLQSQERRLIRLTSESHR
jgi:deoxycytidine triphosphate deaminase